MSNHSEPGRTLEWAQVDVFAEAPCQGNMLAIFPDATDLSDADMQALARETNLSETTFVLPRDAATEHAEGIRVRIFTVEEELPFAGHPTLGTASWLRLNRPSLHDAESLSLHLGVGRVHVRFPSGVAPAGSIVAEMTQPDPQFLGDLPRTAVAAALGLDENQLHPTLAPEMVSTGLPIAVAPLASVDALAALRNVRTLQESLLSTTPAKFLYCIAPGDEAGTWEARLPLYGGEDPATGSAAGCAISYLVTHGAAVPEAPTTILQGRFIHRPSRIVAQASLQNGRVAQVRVSGCTIPVAAGRFFLR